jgi:hypothetical protein
LKARFLARFLPANPEHTPADFEHDVKAFSILSHAAFEEFVEAVSEAMLQMVEADLFSKKATLGTACLLTAYGVRLDLPAEDDGEDKSCFDHIREAIHTAKQARSKTLMDNHGVSAKYIRKQLIPMGISMPAGPEMLSLKKLADARGSFAHTMAKLAHYGEYKKATKAFTPEEAVGSATDCLKICSDIRDRAKTVW